MLPFKSLIARSTSVKSLSFLFVSSHLVLFLMMIFTFPRINAQIGTKAFDLQTFGYSTSVAQSIVTNLNNEITNLYLFPQLSVLDVLYPFLLALFLSSFLYRLMSITKTQLNINSVLLVIPFLAMSFDYSENICIALMITNTIDTSEYFVLLSSTFTILKSTCTSIAWFSILFYGIKFLRVKVNC